MSEIELGRLAYKANIRARRYKFKLADFLKADRPIFTPLYWAVLLPLDVAILKQLLILKFSQFAPRLSQRLFSPLKVLRMADRIFSKGATANKFASSPYKPTNFGA